MLLRRTVLFFGLSSASILLIPFCAERATAMQKVLAISTPLFFWGAMIYAIVCITQADRVRRELSGSAKKIPLFRRGFFCLRKTRIGLYSDIAMWILLAFMVIMTLLRINSMWMLVPLSCLIFSVELHSVFNGIVFRSIEIKMSAEATDDHRTN